MKDCCTVTAGDLKHRVIIEARSRVSDGGGGFTETWTADPVGGVYCSMQFLTGTERWEAYRNMNGNLIRLTMRFRGDANGAPYWQSGTHRVVFRGRVYDILAVSDVGWDRRWLKMDIFEGSPS